MIQDPLSINSNKMLDKKNKNVFSITNMNLSGGQVLSYRMKISVHNCSVELFYSFIDSLIYFVKSEKLF